MRRFLAGIVVLLAPIVAFAQVRGEVESIGFQNIYRPDCWTALTVKLIPETGKTDFYQIQVWQEDADRDRAIFTRTVSVTGNAEGQTREQRFRVYFLPQPTGGGLPDARDQGVRLQDLAEQLVVNVCTVNGKQIARLPVTNSIQNIEPRPATWDGGRRGVKFILAVSEGRSHVIYRDQLATTGIVGVVEDVVFVMARPADLPENVLGYDAIDGIVWLDADPAGLRGGGDEKRRALESYIQRGGRLVICQNPEWQKILEFGDLLPVDIQGVEERNDVETLRGLTRPRREILSLPQPMNDPAWERLKGPFRVARAMPRAGAIVDHWIEWDESGEDRTAYIARKRMGLGGVTWVAQDLGDPAIVTRARSGWPYIWERVFDWKNEPVLLTASLTERDVSSYAPAYGADLGHSALSGIELTSKTAWLITLAIVFFIGYWVVAGPGVFFYLLQRRRAQLSWFAFAGAALIATGLTVVLVKLVLRGPPEMRHFTVVRVAPDHPAVVHSRIGLYIPRDGYQSITLADTAQSSVTSISALAMHPVFLAGGTPRENQGPEYTVPIVDAASNEPASAIIPYSSTLKKLQATWVGEIPGRVEGNPALIDSGWIEGSLTNGTGQRLRNVYIAFKFPGERFDAGDWILYLPNWEDGVTIDLNREFNRAEEGRQSPPTPFVSPDNNPERNRKVRGRIDRDWAPYWYPRLRGGMMGDSKFDDAADTVRRSFPMLSFFERLPPIRNEPQQRADRVELLRRSARYLDVSNALAAGAMVVLAEVHGPLPFPLEVEGQQVSGTGLNLYQFILPLDHSKLARETDDEE